MMFIVRDPELETYCMFVVKAMEHLENAERKVLAMGNGADRGDIRWIYLAAQSIKGVAAILGLGEIRKLSHKLESVFDLVRQGKIAIGESLIRSFLEDLDRLRAMLANLRAGLDRRTRGEGGTWRLDVAEVDLQAGLDELDNLSQGDRTAIE